MIDNSFLHTQPPHSILAEELLLGSLLLKPSPQTINTISNLISVDALMLESHQIIYIIILTKAHKYSINLPKLIYLLSQIDVLHKIGGIDKIMELINQISAFQQLESTNINIKNCIDIIQEKYVRRLLLQWSSYIAQISMSESTKIEIILKQANYYLQKIYQLLKKKHDYSISDIIQDLLTNLESNKLNTKKTKFTGLKCGFRELDRLTQGFQPADLIIIAGRPAMGKTSIALNITNYIIDKTSRGVIIFSFEMSKQQILYRLLSIKCKVPTHLLRNGLISDSILARIKKNCQTINQSFLYIDDSTQISVFTLHSKIKKLVEKWTIVGIIIIDYLQLIQISKLHFENRAQELSSITRILKVLARETKIPIIALSQLNRNVENRAHKRPLLSDLRESGCIQGTINILTNYPQLIVEIKKLIFYFRCLIHSIKSQEQIYLKRLSTISFQGKHHTYSLCTKFYSHLDTTNNHKVLTFAGWQREETLRIIDKSTIMYNHTKDSKYIWQVLTYSTLSFIQWNSSKLVYDVKTNQLVNLIANQIIIHNSIEQDADLVLLLYRDDYYKNNNNSHQITEIILAKHRNGPTGSFQLTFDPLSTTFSNNHTD